MAIPHARSGQVIDVRPHGPSFTGARSVALFESEDTCVFVTIALRR